MLKVLLSSLVLVFFFSSCTTITPKEFVPNDMSSERKVLSSAERKIASEGESCLADEEDLKVSPQTVRLEKARLEFPIESAVAYNKDDKGFRLNMYFLTSEDYVDQPLPASIAEQTQQMQLMLFQIIEDNASVYGKLFDKEGREIYKFYKDVNHLYHKCK